MKILVAFQLTPTAEHKQPEIIRVKEEISNEVSRRVSL